MNDIAKENIQKKLIKAMETEGVSSEFVARVFEVNSSYLSWLKRPAYWNKLGSPIWEKLLLWVNSGQTLKQYAEKKGKFMPKKPLEEKHEHSTIPIDLKEEKQKEAISSEQSTTTDVLIKVKPGVIEKRQEELAERNCDVDLRMTNTIEKQKIVIDIEINILLNGQKIKLA